MSRGYLAPGDPLAYAVVGGKLAVTLKNGTTVGLQQAEKFAGFQGDGAAPDPQFEQSRQCDQGEAQEHVGELHQ